MQRLLILNGPGGQSFPLTVWRFEGRAVNITLIALLH